MRRSNPAATALFIGGVWSMLTAADSTNTITRNQFNFGHQLGYIYARMDDAYFGERGCWRFETGLAALYTGNMPRVRNPYWKERTMVYIPLYFELSPSDNISLQIELTDLFVEFPYYDITSMGGKSPRFKTKIRLLRERKYLPAIALTVGVKFSSAKPYVIWRGDHNYDESNGLAGAGTGVADYLLLFTFSKSLTAATSLHSHLGLAPLGSPVDEYGYGSRQADEIPYGLSLRHNFSPRWSARFEVCGMFNGLRASELAQYSVARLRLSWKPGNHSLALNVEHGLTEESDEWVGGLFGTFEWKVR
ncbi:MAG: hypothetical protein JW913_10090 [Chitinispirillaceae bacterium]|nr:hypothetical protein [Chitinispirillaceae bacterium]